MWEDGRITKPRQNSKNSLTKRGLWALCGRMGGGYQKTIVGEGVGDMWELCGRRARKPYLGGGRGGSVT